MSHRLLVRLAALASAWAVAAALLGGLWATATASGPAPPPQPPPFYWVTETLADRAAAADPPLLPDLSVQWIERTPRYHRYCVDYGRGLPELCPGTENDRRFPEPGEIVTWTARIANQGTITSPAALATWQIGEAILAPQALPALGSGVTVTLPITWPWPSTPFSVTLAVDPGAVQEVTRANNAHSQRSDALYLEVLTHPLIDAAFARRPNLMGSWGFADWMQAQVRTMNANLAASAYPTAPQGAADRVRIDRILITEDVGDDTVTSSLDFDGRWSFRVEADDPDTPEDEAVLSAENYAAAFAQQIDWGLIHELTHQLGAIDLYQLNVAGSYQNQVLDGDGWPLLLGFQWPRPDLMGGGDLGNYPWYRYSEHTVLALQSNQGQRRGYFGEYLYDLPGQASLLVLDNRGEPLPGAQVTAYQANLGVVLSGPVWGGITGADGRLALPDQPVPFGGVTTATGHILASNPFGAIDVVGANGQLLLHIGQEGQHFYTWWPITDFNVARWHGLGSYERAVATHLPSAGAPAPPARLDGLVDGLEVTLTWAASPTSGVTAYRVYRGEEPDFYPFTPITTTTALTGTHRSLHTARYAVTAIDAQGRESGFSPIFRAQRLVYPVATVVDAATGQRVILDRHDGGLVAQLPDDRWLGRQGSVHLGLTGSQSLASNGQGQLLVAASGENRVKVVDPSWPVAAVAPQVVNWFGQERFVTGTLSSPASVLQAGPGLTVAVKPRPDPTTLGLASFDNRLDLSGAAPVLAGGVTPAPGRFDGGVRVNSADRLEYAAAGHFATGQGAVELWVRPEWVWDDDEEHVFLEAGAPSPSALGPVPPGWFPISDRAPTGFRLRLAKADWNGLYAQLSDGVRSVVLYAAVDDWQPGQWRHLAVAWQAVQPGTPYRRYTLWIDGVLRDSQVLRRPADGLCGCISVGAGLDGADQADATLDELRISDAARVGNSQQVRLVISQAAAGRVDVVDWLGAPVSTLGGFQAPHGLAMLANQVFVADPAGGSIHVLGFDGQALTRLATWSEDLIAPYSLAALDSGQLLVSDQGDHQVKLLAEDGAVLRRWTGPTDSHAGPFLQPAGLAMLPDGDALVADAGNGRVARIITPAQAARSFLPLICIR